MCSNGKIRTMTRWFQQFAFTAAAFMTVGAPAFAQDTGATSSGNWEDSTNWTCGSAATMAAAGNVTGNIDLYSGSTLNLGANLNLSGNLNIQDSSALDMNGNWNSFVRFGDEMCLSGIREPQWRVIRY
jgi:hypothetical protein